MTSDQIHPQLRKILLIQFIFPICLLTFGIYHGLVQVLYRAGIIRGSSFLGIDYYQGLTLHGVINAVVFTTFFAVAFGSALIAYYLKRVPNRAALWASTFAMIIGTLLAAYAILFRNASVLYTFYPPLRADPLFYIGATLLVVGSWLPFFAWIPEYLSWRKENPQQKTPLAVVGILATFIVWLTATIPLAYEVLVLLLPWSLGWVSSVNVTLARTLFWFFGHPLVYFWLLPSYVMFYVMLPKVAGGRLFSDFAGRSAFMLFVVFSAPVGLHHQFSDPSIGSNWKWLQTFFTFGVALPSFVTAFTLAASLEDAARARGGRGLFRWWAKLPYWDEERWLFPYFFCGLLLFLFGGITGIINASNAMNSLVHNTSWLPGHFHTTVGGPVFLSFIAMSLWIVSQLLGKEVKFKKLILAVPYLWLAGISFFSIALSISGLQGEPRRTNLGLSYTNPESPLYHSNWAFLSHFTAIGGSIMFLAMVFYFVGFFGTLFSKRVREVSLELPTSEVVHDEQIPAVANFKPWILVSILALAIAYVPPFFDVFRGTFNSAPPYQTDNPNPRK